MAALYALETILGGLFGLFVAFQVVIPLLYREPLFPMFRKKKLDAEAKLTIAEEEIEIAAIEKEAAEAESLAAKIRETIPKGDSDAK